ncbi:unnamed protein product [Macrosiphum euphorbiae]|uniref:Uncharacterized protein n=1 Tax=Macrosiphum euphorbiae TaxID=13131 RepID=A0AAV0XI91_9HEMI|nr:unnamed protein product [Macrosiphum euphorbiae]
MLKQNEMQLNIKKDKEKAEKEKDYDLVKILLQNFQVFNEVEEKKNAERRQKMIFYGKRVKNVDRPENRSETKTEKDCDERIFGGC